jgi:hypothetical protein
MKRSSLFGGSVRDEVEKRFYKVDTRKTIFLRNLKTKQNKKNSILSKTN